MVEFGISIKKLHSVNIPTDMAAVIPKEEFSEKWCTILKSSIQYIEQNIFEDVALHKTAVFLKEKAFKYKTLLSVPNNLLMCCKNRIYHMFYAMQIFINGIYLFLKQGAFLLSIGIR